jgi:hypothetical protein
MHKIKLNELRSIIKSVVRESSMYGDEIEAFEFAESYGDEELDDLVGLAGYKRLGGDLDKIGRAFRIEEDQDDPMCYIATDNQTGARYRYDTSLGKWSRA